MLQKSAKIFALIFAALPAFGQGFITLYQATASGTSANFNNSNPKYNAWTVMYNYSGSGTFSIELDCAPDATTAGGTPTPGTFAACSNTVTGTNPSTTPAYGYITFLGYTPWLRLNLTAISSGNLTAAAVAFNPADPEGSSGGGCAGTVSTPCIVAGPNASGSASTKNPVQIAGNDGTDVRNIKTDTSGNIQAVGTAATGAAPVGNPLQIGELDGNGNIIPPTYASLSAAISLSASGLTQVVAAVSAKQIRIEHISASFASAVNFQLEYGTGTNCGTGTTALTGVYQSILTAALDFDAGTLNVPAGNALCVNLGSAATGGGVVVYGQY